MTTVYAGREGYVLANPFQMNLEHGPDVDNDAVDFWNNWDCHDASGTPGTNPACLEHGANWLDPEVYVLAVADAGECLTSWTYAADTEDTGDDSECLQWTITGWNHTILGGDIVGNSLVISPANAYRPFSAEEVVNTQEVFTGQMKTEFTAFNFEGEIGSGTVFTPVLLEDECDCDGNFADCNGDCSGSAVVDECGVCDGDNSSCEDCCGVPNGDDSTCDGECGACNAVIPDGNCDCDGNVDAGCGCGEAGPSGCDNACGSTLVVDECGACGGG
jgi:hypothetical protein